MKKKIYQKRGAALKFCSKAMNEELRNKWYSNMV